MLLLIKILLSIMAVLLCAMGAFHYLSLVTDNPRREKIFETLLHYFFIAAISVLGILVIVAIWYCLEI